MSNNSGGSGHDVHSFYGKKASKLIRSLKEKIERREEEFSTRPVPDMCPRYGILGPCPAWDVFPTQLAALDQAEQDPTLFVFAFESSTFGGAGKRQFVVADPRVFYDNFRNRPLAQRTAYEVIPVHRRSKLYFDLEFEKDLNESKDGVAMTKVLISIVQHLIESTYNVPCPHEKIVNLDSSTSKKFSKHLIFDLESIAFKNNLNVGNFVRSLCEKITKSCTDNSTTDLTQSIDHDFHSLFVNTKDGHKALFIDQGVYSRNRNFRLYQATKYGKNTPLLLAHDATGFTFNSNDEDIFLASLVTFVSPSCRTVTFGDQELTDRPKPALSSLNNVKCAARLASKSPFEELDDFISNQINGGTIRRWTYFDKTQTIVYTIEGYRYCHNIGREHKSNGIFYVVNIATMTWYQKCFDPECRGYKSAEWELPAHSVPWSRGADEADWSNNSSDESKSTPQNETQWSKEWWDDEYDVMMQSADIDLLGRSGY